MLCRGICVYFLDVVTVCDIVALYILVHRTTENNLKIYREIGAATSDLEQFFVTF